MFSFEPTGAFSNDKSYFVPTDDLSLLALLNSKLGWFFLSSASPAVRAGWHEMRVQYVEIMPIEKSDAAALVQLASIAASATDRAKEQLIVESAVSHRIFDLDPRGRSGLPRKLAAWAKLDFRGFMAEVKKAFGVDIPLKQRGEWEAYLAEQGAEVRRLSAATASAEAEIDRIVYGLFDLAPAEIALLEVSLAGQR